MVESSLKSRLRDEMDEEMPMAKGGEVREQAGIDEIKPDKGFGKIIIMKAEGGMVDEDCMDSADDGSIASAIMKRRKMANGGQVDIENNAQEMPNAMDELNKAALKENYDEDLMSVSQPMDSNEHGDRREMIKSIRNKMISKRILGMK